MMQLNFLEVESTKTIVRVRKIGFMNKLYEDHLKNSYFQQETSIIILLNFGLTFNRLSITTSSSPLGGTLALKTRSLLSSRHKSKSAETPKGAQASFFSVRAMLITGVKEKLSPPGDTWAPGTASWAPKMHPLYKNFVFAVASSVCLISAAHAIFVGLLLMVLIVLLSFAKSEFVNEVGKIAYTIVKRIFTSLPLLVLHNCTTAGLPLNRTFLKGKVLIFQTLDRYSNDSNSSMVVKKFQPW